jgi:diguanylate cyclase (GGDEF)-like protein
MAAVLPLSLVPLEGTDHAGIQPGPAARPPEDPTAPARPGRRGEPAAVPEHDVLMLKFLRSLPSRRAQLDEFWQDCRGAASDGPAWSRLTRALHLLRGASEAYGRDAIAHAADAVEQAVSTRPTAADTGFLAGLEAAMRKLLTAIDATAGRPDEAMTLEPPAPAVAVWLDPPTHPALAGLRDLLLIGGFRVEGVPDAGAVARVRARAHVLVTAIDDPVAAAAALKLHTAALELTGRPRHCIAVVARDDYTSRLALSRAGVGTVLPGTIERAALMRVVETEAACVGAPPARIGLLCADAAEATAWNDALIKANLEPRLVADAEHLWRLAHNQDLDGVLLAASDRVASAIELARAIREDEYNLQLPLVLVHDEPSAAQRRALAAAGIECAPGMTEPDVPVALLRERVSRQARRVHVLRTDPLTGAMTRVAFALAMQRALSGTAAQLAFAIVDLDDFKAINDRFGHEAGDRALRDTVRRLRDALPPAGFVGRFGGDEFVVGFSASDEPSANRVLSRLAQRGVRLFDGGETAGYSVGAILLDRSDRDGSVTVERLTALADGLLARSKLAGKNRLSVARYREASGLPPMSSRASRAGT